MSRRLEITVPNDWALPVRECLEDPLRCNLSEKAETKPCMIVELTGRKNTIFFVTIPGPVVSPTLETLRKNGIGTTVGRIILSTLDYLKPDLARPLAKPDAIMEETDEKVEPVAPGKKAAPLKGFAHFQKARKTTEEMYNDISNGAQMNMNTWMNLIGASVMAAGGLTTNVIVFIVAAMLVSPIMGPILGMTFGYRISDWPLFRTGFINEVKMAICTFTIGALVGLILGDVGNTYKWPNSAMMPEGQGFNMIISIVVSAAAGMVLGVSMTSTGGNALVGTAISAGLLPPLVNAGMLISYSWAYGTKEQKKVFYELGSYSILFYLTHVITIVIVANFVFYLKDIDPRFRDGEDSNFNDIPSLVEHKRKMLEAGHTYNEKDKAEFFIGHIKDDLTDFTMGLKDKASNLTSILTGGAIGKRSGAMADQSVHSKLSTIDEGGEGDDLESGQNSSGKQIHKGSIFFNAGVKSSSRRNSARGSFSTVGNNEEAEEGGVEMSSSHKSLQDSYRLAPAPTRNSPRYEQDSDVINPLQQSSPRGSVSPSGSNNNNTIHNNDLNLKVFAFYQKYNPSKLDDVPSILEKYKGQEAILLAKLQKQYNVTDF